MLEKDTLVNSGENGWVKGREGWAEKLVIGLSQ